MHTIWSGFVNFSTERNCRCYNNNERILTQHRYTFKAPLLSRTYENPYYPTALGLYFNYTVHGMGVILMSLNMASLETLWQTNAAGVSIVISSLGIGRLSVLLLQDYYPIALVAALYHARDVLLYGLLFWHPAHQ